MRRVSVLVAVIVAVGCAAPVPEPAEVAPETAVETGDAEGGYAEGGYAEGGYAEGGYAEGGYAEGGYAEFGQSRISYEIQGQGPPLILIHGGLLDGRMWDGQFDMFAGRYRVIRYDASGHGRSATPPDAEWDRVVELFQRSWTDGPRRAPEEVDADVREKVRMMSRNTVEHATEGRTMDPPAIDRLAELTIPMLVVVGELDMPDIHEIADLLVAANPNARRIQIEGVAHMVNMENPEDFNRVVSAYLEKLGY
jgi:pimeloyl-ACP methyl ester carboxylesterase